MKREPIRALALLAACAAAALAAGCYDSTGYGAAGDPDAGGDTETSSDGWTCAEAYYGATDGCDCGCGIDDPDCAGAGCAEPGCAADGCAFCWDGAGGNISCTPAPDGWTCADGFYDANDGCDCGCGVDDPDCAGAGCTEPSCLADGCDWCWDGAGGNISCTPAPDGWSCNDAYYGDGTCDCGCGVDDLDCAGAGCAEPGCYEPACQYCFDDGGVMITCTPEADAGADGG